jgi:hypothetical protein
MDMCNSRILCTVRSTYAFHAAGDRLAPRPFRRTPSLLTSCATFAVHCFGDRFKALRRIVPKDYTIREPETSWAPQFRNPGLVIFDDNALIAIELVHVVRACGRKRPALSRHLSAAHQF